jgi:hypothetical protein
MGGKDRTARYFEGIREALRDVYEAPGETHLECSEIRDLGDRVVMLGRFQFRGSESGAQSESPWGAVADFKDGKAIRIRGYFSHEEVLEAVPLSE